MNVGVQMLRKYWVSFSSSSGSGPGTPITLIEQLTNPTSSVSRGQSGPGPEKRTQGQIGLRPGEQTTEELRRQVVADGETCADDAMGLGVTAPLNVSGRPMPPHVFAHCVDDRQEMGLLVKLDLLLRKPLSRSGRDLSAPGQERERLAPHRVHSGSKEWLKPPFHVQRYHAIAGTWAGPFRTCEAHPPQRRYSCGPARSRLHQQNTCGWIAPVMRSKVERTQIGGNPDGL
jgi:hypothetical protein